MRASRIDGDMLSRVVDYRQFILTVLGQGESGIARGRLAALARRSGLSRSFITEILKKRKRLTSDSVTRLANGLKLNSNERKFFEALVAIEVPNSSLRLSKSKSDLIEEIESHRSKIRQKSKSNRFKKKISRNLLSLDLFLVYAALGSIETGASFSEIVRKTKLGRLQVQKVLTLLTNDDWIKFEHERYYASERAIDLEDLGINEGFLHAFSMASAELSRSAPEIAKDRSNLIFFTAIPLNENRLSEFRLRMQAAVLDVIDEFQDDAGSVVKKITLGVN